MSQVTKIVVKRVQNASYNYFKVAKISNPKGYMLTDLDEYFPNMDALQKYINSRATKDTVIEVLNG